MQVQFLRRALWGVAGAVLIPLAGCHDPLTYDNFSRIYESRTSQAEVARLIGEPDEKLDNQWLYERPGKHLTAIVDFSKDGRVSRKQWVDAMNAVWEDTADDGSFEAGSQESTRIEKGVD